MTAQVDGVNCLPRFVYSPLQDGEFRVITFEQGSDEEGPIRLHIHHVRMQYEEEVREPNG